jgi:hydroxymethylbilane synthase
VRTLRIGSRSSRLALWQAGWVRDRLQSAGHTTRIEVIRTSGDQHLDRPLASFGGKGIFVKEIEEALLAGSIDLAVHSLKDLPTSQPEGLRILCVPEREDPRDILLARDGAGLDALRAGAVVGTGSPRRVCQIRALRPDLAVRDLRGNVDTRIRKLESGDYDGIVLALAGVRRLGSAARGEVLDLDRMIPAVGQGAMAVEGRAGDDGLAGILATLHHAESAAAVSAERAVLRALGGGCQAPIAAVAEIRGDRLLLRGLVGDPESGRLVRHRLEGAAAEPEEAGRRLADALLERGAADLLRLSRLSSRPAPEPEA